jgi:hypothetical protein
MLFDAMNTCQRLIHKIFFISSVFFLAAFSAFPDEAAVLDFRTVAPLCENPNRGIANLIPVPLRLRS